MKRRRVLKLLLLATICIVGIIVVPSLKGIKVFDHAKVISGLGIRTDVNQEEQGLLADQSEESLEDIDIQDELLPASSLELNVLDFGAVADGLTDNTAAFQRALKAASAQQKKLLIPASEEPYLITDTLTIWKDTFISGYGATLYMPSSDEVVNLLLTYGRNVRDVRIEGLSLISTAEVAGEGFAIGRLTSNVQGIHLTGAENVELIDIEMTNMYVGLKMGKSADDLPNLDVRVDHMTINNAFTALLMNTTEGFTMTNSLLDAGAGNDSRLHSAYIDRNCRDINFDYVSFDNSPGGGLHIYNGYPGTASPTDITVTNSQIRDAKVGVYVYSGSSEVSLTNVEILRSELAFSISNVSGLSLENVSILEGVNPSGSARGCFYIKNLYDSSMDGLIIDGRGMEGAIFGVYAEMKNVAISGVVAENVEDIYVLYTAADATVEDVTIRDGAFTTTDRDYVPVRLIGRGSNILIENSSFVNEGVENSSVVYGEANSGLIFRNNTYTGYSKLAHESDTSLLEDNRQIIVDLEVNN